MKLDHPSMFAIEHSAGGFGMPDTPTSDEGTYVGPISLHNAIGPKRPHPAPLRRLMRNCERRGRSREYTLVQNLLPKAVPHDESRLLPGLIVRARGRLVEGFPPPEC